MLCSPAQAGAHINERLAISNIANRFFFDEPIGKSRNTCDISASGGDGHEEGIPRGTRGDTGERQARARVLVIPVRPVIPVEILTNFTNSLSTTRRIWLD